MCGRTAGSVCVCVCTRLHAICIVVMRAPGMMECTTTELWGCARAGATVACAHAASFPSLFPVLMMMLIIYSASFHPPRRTNTCTMYTCTHTRAPKGTSLQQQTRQHLLGHKLWFMRDGERCGETFGLLTGFSVRWAATLGFSGTSSPG